MDVPDPGSAADYLQAGPRFVAFFHPALGPLWDVIAQKIRGGRLAPRAELQLEVAEAELRDVHVDGSLLVEADSPLGRLAAPPGGADEEAAGPSLRYGEGCGRVRLRGVTVRNAGIDWAAGNAFWRNAIERREAARILLRGDAEFDARDCVIDGDVTFDVPAGHRLLVTAAPGGGLRTELLPLPGGRPSWEWRYSLAAGDDGRVLLQLEERVGGASLAAGG